MTVAFLVFVPFAMGYVSVICYLKSGPEEDIHWYEWLFLPWLSVLISMIVAALIKSEGIICLIFAAPIILLFAMIGGIAARVVWGRTRHRSVTTLSVAVLPAVLLLIELHVPVPQEIRTVSTETMIHAPAAVVWNNIKSVRVIDSSELRPAWVTRIGFPKPIAATLSHDGIGGVREASFTGGLIFTETINLWKQGEDLRFSIRANTDSIPPTLLDEHVTIGGAFFDVLEGEYQVEQRPDGVLLHLTSRERLSTHFNPYAAVWTDAVMRSIQEQILEVIRTRCESDAGLTTLRPAKPDQTNR